LLHIINDILDYSKIQARKLSLIQEPFAFEEILDNLSGLFALSAEKKEIELFFHIDRNIPEYLIGDQIRLTQILINLIGNAIKFTDKGEIILTVKAHSIDENACELLFSVKDTGIGIEEKDQKKLFHKFSQVDSSYKRKYEGTGLGLVISKELVELMGGQISLKSFPGEGTTLLFNAKFGVDLINNPKENLQNIKRGDSILVIDDSEISRIILHDVLHSFGMKIDLSEDGIDALKKVEISLQNKSPYDFILLDWKMPKLSGAQTAKKINQLYLEYDINLKPVVIMVTEYSKDELIEELKSYDLHPTNILLKPVTASTLYDSLIRGKQKSKKSSSESIYTYDERLKTIVGANVLLVEDNEINQDVATAYLRKMKVNITIANNGLEALKLVTEKSFDIILMDLQMPVMDGIEAAKEIRKLKNKKTIPIIAMTAAAMEKDKENSKAAGMNAHITKPIDLEELKETLLTFIEPNKENRNLKIKNQHSCEGAMSFPHSIEGIDLPKLLIKLDEDKYLLSKLLLDFANKYKDSEGILQESEVQSAAFHAFIHTLKGVSGNLLIGEVYRLARLINESSDVNQKTLWVHSLRDALMPVIQNIQKSIKPNPESGVFSLLGKYELLNILDEFIPKLNSNFIIPFEETKKLLHALDGVIDEQQLQKLQEKFDVLEYDEAKIELSHIKEKIYQGVHHV
jgi:CheY-like chemotaxis protein